MVLSTLNVLMATGKDFGVGSLKLLTVQVTSVQLTRCGPWVSGELCPSLLGSESTKFYPLLAGFSVFKESKYPEFLMKYPDF